MYTLAHHRQGFAGCELAGVPQRMTRSGDPAPRELYFDYLPCLRVVWAIPVTGVSNGIAGGADLILTKVWRPPPQCRQWSIHCLGNTNTCGNRIGLGNTYTEGSSTPICGWKTIFLVRCRGGSLLGLRWCQRIQLLIIDLACSQQNGADHPKESKRRNWERARYTIHNVCHDRDGR